MVFIINKCAKNKNDFSFPTDFLIGDKHVSDPNIIANEFNNYYANIRIRYYANNFKPEIKVWYWL